MASEKLKTGTLTKRGRGYPHKWQEREFNLHADRIEYFAGGLKKGQFPIDNTSTVEKADNERPIAFRLTTGSDMLLMSATDEGLRDEWMQAIQNAAKSNDAAPPPIFAGLQDASGVKANPTKPPAKLAVSCNAGKKQPMPSSMMEKEAFADQFGLGVKSLPSTQGKVLGDKFPAFIAAFDDEGVAEDCKLMIANQFKKWAQEVPAVFREEKLTEQYEKLLALVLKLCTAEDDDYDGQQKYWGRTHWAAGIAGGISTTCSMDDSQKLATLVAPSAFAIVEEILHSGRALKDKGSTVKECAATGRAETLLFLLRICPYSGSVSIPNGMDVIARLLTDSDMPATLKRQAKSSISTMSQVNKAAMKTAGPALMEIIAQGDNDNLIMSFASNPEMYTNNPEAVHKHLGYILEMDYIKICSILHSVAQRAPMALVPHFDKIKNKLDDNSQMGMTLVVIKLIAAVSPDTVYPHVDFILQKAESIVTSVSSLAGVVGNCGKATKPKDAADNMFRILIKGLNECKEAVEVTSWITEISNIKSRLSSRDILKDELPAIMKHKKAVEVMVQDIENYAEGREVAVVVKRIDPLGAQVLDFNNRVEASAKSYDDVVSYVDQNIADVNDFTCEIAKKLPLPKRLEVVGAKRKTLILHFECVRTGDELPIETHEWSKWLKMGFTLVLAGKAVLDVGSGNPLGLVSTGVECVKGIYDAYKSNDDDEFNTFISNPFLTSTEQDVLIEKLRAQHFFDEMSYDIQKGGWYLNDPKMDSLSASVSVDEKKKPKKPVKKGKSGGIAPPSIMGGAPDAPFTSRGKKAQPAVVGTPCTCTIM